MDDRFTAGRRTGLTRRELLKRSAAAGAILSVPIILASCGGSGSTEEESQPASATPDATAPTTPGSTSGGEAVGDFSARFAEYEPAVERNGDLSRVVWPEFVVNAPSEVKRLYEFQVTHGELMRYMPCFCGCGNAGHRNNRDCYIQEVKPDGSVVFDAMAPT